MPFLSSINKRLIIPGLLYQPPGGLRTRVLCAGSLESGSGVPSMCSVGRCDVQFRRYVRPASGCVWPLRPQLPNGIVPGPSVRAASDRRDGAWASACHKSAHSSTACRSAGWKTRKAMVPELLLQHLQTSAPTHIDHGQRETRQQAICVRAGAEWHVLSI